MADRSALPVPAPAIPRAAADLAGRLAEIDDPVARGLALLRIRLLSGPEPSGECAARRLLDHAQDGAGGTLFWLLLERLDEAELSGDPGAIGSARTYARFLASRCADARERAEIEAISAPDGTEPAIRRARWIEALRQPTSGIAAALARARRDRCTDPALSTAWAARTLFLVAASPGGDAISAARALEDHARRAGAPAMTRFAADVLASLGSSALLTPGPVTVTATPPAEARRAHDTPVASLLPAGPDPDESDTDAMLERARSSIAAGRWLDATAWLERAARRVRDPEARAGHYFELGRITQDELHNPSGALEHFLVSFICRAADRTLDRLEDLYRRTGRLRELVGAYDIAIDDRRSRGDRAALEDVLLRKAQLEATELERPEKAARTLLEAIRLNPTDRYAVDLMVNALADRVPDTLVREAVAVHQAALPAGRTTDPVLARWA